MSKRSRVLEVSAAGVLAAVVIACGDAAMDQGGKIMSDAGEWLGDAGETLRDAGTALRDAGRAHDAGGSSMMDMGGHMLADAGEMLSDAGSSLRDAGSDLQDAGAPAPDAGNAMIDAAAAQSSCGSCTAGMRQMVVTADQDAQQLRGDTLEGSRWNEITGASVHATNCNADVYSRSFWAKLVDGPFVLTDLYGLSSAGAQLFIVPTGEDCYTVTTSAIPLPYNCTSTTDFVTPQLVQRAQPVRSLFFVGPNTSLTGARIVIAPGERLCAFIGSATPLVSVSNDPGALPVILWSGFAPYE